MMNQKPKTETEQFTIRIPVDLANKLRTRSLAVNKSVTRLIVDRLKAGVK